MVKNLCGISYFDPAKGETKELIDRLIDSKKWGKNEGGEEMIAVLEVLANLEQSPYLNSLIMKNSTIWSLAREFAQAFFPHPPEKSELLEYLVTKHQWDELPIYCIGFSNATNALTACLEVHGVRGCEVITTSYNYAAAPNAIVSAGAKPRFVDIDAKTYCMNISSALEAVNENTRAILLTHVNQGIDLLPLIKGLDEKGRDIAIFQDGTAAMGSLCNGLGAGQINPPPHGVTVFSLGPTKLISGLDGALIVTHDYEFLRQVESLSFCGLNPANHEEVLTFGNNYKMNELSSAIALAQLKKRESLIARRKKLKERYDKALAPLVNQGKITLQQLSSESVVTHYMVKTKKTYQPVITELARQFKIVASHWYRYHLDALYVRQFGSYQLPVTEALADKIIFLPFHIALESEDVQYIANALDTVLSQP